MVSAREDEEARRCFEVFTDIVSLMVYRMVFSEVHSILAEYTGIRLLNSECENRLVTVYGCGMGRPA
jgi:hypothetical protein